MKYQSIVLARIYYTFYTYEFGEINSPMYKALYSTVFTRNYIWHQMYDKKKLKVNRLHLL